MARRGLNKTNHGCRGLVATFQAFQNGLGPFLVTRLLLGCVKFLGTIMI
jgi:hypothetical protein